MLLISYGTRPEWIKIKPIIDELNSRSCKYKLLCTGQHVSIFTNTSSPTCTPYQIQENNKETLLTIKNGDNRLDSIVTSILNNNSIFENISNVMVQGDTASAFSIALAAFHRKIPIIHLEAGLRSYDINNPYPEEFYRRSISNMASIHLCPTADNLANLKKEQIGGETFVTGNTAIDSLLKFKQHTSSGGGCVITLHRRENRPLLPYWISEINNISKLYNIPFTFIIHPNMENDIIKQIDTKKINIIFPIPHDEMLTLINKCDIIVSDSGGLQEEASFLGKPIVVCRTTTERPESIGITSFICDTPTLLSRVFKNAISAKIPDVKCPFGSGDSAKIIVDILYGQRLYT